MASSTRQLTIGELEERFRGAKDVVEPVSYTHLTLPTKA